MQRSGENGKRHTRPCRYYQISTCPYTAEQCDFAHVIEPTSPCRYYMAGNCLNGSWCQWEHPRSKDIHDPYAVAFYSSGVGQYPFYLPPSAPPVYSPGKVDPRHLKTIEALVMSPSNSFASPASSPSCSPTSPINTAPQRRVQESQRRPDVATQKTQLIIPKSPAPGAKSNLRTKNTKKKLEMFKTKPCRYYKIGQPKSCPSGDQCTFIHEDPEEMPRPALPTYQPENRVPHPLPPKPVNEIEEQRKNGIFPISWRVIGGGVYMGKRAPESPKSESTVSPGTESSKMSSAQLEYTEKRRVSNVIFPSEEEGPRPSMLRGHSGRIRATSMEDTPRGGSNGTLPLFPAESPGVL